MDCKFVVGQKVVCIGCADGDDELHFGHVYTITRIVPHAFDKKDGSMDLRVHICLEELHNWNCYLSDNFKPIQDADFEWAHEFAREASKHTPIFGGLISDLKAAIEASKREKR
jgi:hypothetical protein